MIANCMGKNEMRKTRKFNNMIKSSEREKVNEDSLFKRQGVSSDKG